VGLFGTLPVPPSVESFSNGVYTVAFDPVSLTTLEGRKFLTIVGGKAGTQLSDDYAQILRRTHVSGQIVVIQALEQQMNGHKPGDYGIQSDANSVGPSPAPTPSVSPSVSTRTASAKGKK